MPKLLDIPEILLPSPDCGKACVRAVFQFLSLPELIAERLASDPLNGQPPPRIIDALRAGGVTRVVSGEMGLEILESFWRQGWPVILPIQMPDYEDGHYVVYRGSSRGNIHYHCPIYGRVSLPKSEFLDRWSDVDSSGRVYRQYGIAVATD